MINNLNIICDRLIKDENILQEVKSISIKTINNKNLIEKTNDFSEIISNLNDSFNKSFLELINSIDFIEKNYAEIYSINPTLFQSIKKIAINHKLANESWVKMNEDKNLAAGVSRMVALWLTSDYSQIEKENYYKSILKEIYNNDPLILLDSISLIKSNYDIIYKFKPEFFDELYKYCNCKINSVDKDNINSINFSTKKNNIFSSRFKNIFRK